MRIAKIALFLIMLNFVSKDTEDASMEHCCLNCYVCNHFNRNDIEFYSLDVE
jgi:hypothetical protein